MRVERSNNENNVPQVLWHIQNMNICTDGDPFDMFVWSETEPDEECLKKVIFEGLDEPSESEIDEFITSSRIYPVYAEDVN